MSLWLLCSVSTPSYFTLNQDHDVLATAQCWREALWESLTLRSLTSSSSALLWDWCWLWGRLWCPRWTVSNNILFCRVPHTNTLGHTGLHLASSSPAAGRDVNRHVSRHPSLFLVIKSARIFHKRTKTKLLKIWPWRILLQFPNRLWSVFNPNPLSDVLTSVKSNNVELPNLLTH